MKDLDINVHEDIKESDVVGDTRGPVNDLHKIKEEGNRRTRKTLEAMERKGELDE